MEPAYVAKKPPNCKRNWVRVEATKKKERKSEERTTKEKY